jgi:hypothetical protein
MEMSGEEAASGRRTWEGRPRKKGGNGIAPRSISSARALRDCGVGMLKRAQREGMDISGKIRP